MGIIVHVTKSVLSTAFAIAYSFVCCLTNQLIYSCQDAWKTILFEVTRRFQRLTKVHDETTRKLSHLLPIESWAEMKPETRKSYLECSSRKPFRCTPLQDVINLIVCFRSNHARENLNAIIRHQEDKFGPFVTNKQTYFYRLQGQWIQILWKCMTFNNWYWAFAFESVLKCNCTPLCFLYFDFNSIIILP